MPSFRLNRIRSPKRPRIVITIGDPFGIGPEIVLKAVASRKIKGLADFIIVGDGSVISEISKLRGVPALQTSSHLVDLCLIGRDSIKFGSHSRLTGRASLAYLDCALSLIKDKKADCLVNAPVSKEAIASTGIKFSGHTEYIAEKFDTDDFAMMLIGGPLRVTLVTRHIPVKSVSRAITREEILKCIELSYKTLIENFSITNPRIGVSSLNPHGGEGGKIGREEIETIAPAVSIAKRHFKSISGPASSESLFYLAYRGKLDCVIAMYHDQGLTPLKMIARDNSINVTLGLPFARTSPGHGTAFDIAGRGIADPGSMIESIKLAIRMSRKGRD